MSKQNHISSATKTSFKTTMNSFPENFRSKLKQEWLDSFIAELNNSNPGFDNFDLAEKEKLILERFLLSDMKFSCGCMLPENTHTFDLAHHTDPLVLQVNRMGHINDRPENKCLPTMTDDVQYTLRVEIIPIEDLQVSSPAGFKIVILKGKFVDGLLQLVPEGLEVLGAMVEDLGDAHPKSVEEVFESPKSESYIWDIPAPC